MAKLVRDGYKPSNNGFSLRKVENQLEHSSLLRKKMSEELFELAEDNTRVGAAIEAGDLIESVFSYCLIQWGLTEDEVMSERKKKSDRLGGFTIGKVWVEG